MLLYYMNNEYMNLKSTNERAVFETRTVTSRVSYIADGRFGTDAVVL